MQIPQPSQSQPQYPANKFTSSYINSHSEPSSPIFFFFNDTATTEIYPLSLHAALPISDAARALRHGAQFGVLCSACCAGLMAVLLVAGMMHLAVAAAVAGAIALERLAPRPERIVRATGVITIGAGAFAIARALVAGPQNPETHPAGGGGAQGSGLVFPH